MKLDHHKLWYWNNLENKNWFLELNFSFLICILLQDKVVKGKALENRQEEDRKQLRVSLDDAENRNTKAELMRRALEGDIQRLKLANNDKETENQVTY